MAMTCVNGAKECDGCMRCQGQGDALKCPVCGEELSIFDTVYVQNDEVIGCEHCTETSTAEVKLI